MELVLLQSLQAVAEHRSVTRAARSLGLTQPALTRRLQQLEAWMGAPLLERSRRGVALTEAGRLCTVEAKELEARVERLRESVRATQELERGVVRVGGGATAVSFLLPSTIAQFSVQRPGVRFEVREGGSRDVEEAVLAERLELGIVTLPTHSRDLEVHPLARDRVVPIARVDHPLARKRRLDAAGLDGVEVVAFESGSAIRTLIDDELKAAGVRVRVQMELRSIAAIVEMVAHTRMLGFVSHLGLHDASTVRALDVRGLSIHRRLAVIHKLNRPLSPAASAFAKALRREHAGRTDAPTRAGK